ncbi:transcriptional regulator of NAD metabolism [Clostridium algifaecis]|uniref:Transcriptional regulator of NAD metabolism n=1 Tax=Clostridium algifaecis TaxID=1472040 RepID=A0ABS4KVL2_9CLOT|nr:transcription repressor NadR [Clostridium algifaecis]MBP2034082.1 transcriptional regulator of NAD metabolism [Clostridium algifaecis]
MNSEKRRIDIEKILKSSNKPQKGHILAEKLGVTRQVIVKDIAILRAEGKNIIATPEGYMVPKSEKNRIKKVIAVCHSVDEMEDELSTIVKFGAIVEDVTIEHSVYGEIKAMLMIKSLYDVENFILKIKETKSEPLLILTGGVHLHTISTDNYSAIDNIKSELKNKGYLISD